MPAAKLPSWESTLSKANERQRQAAKIKFLDGLRGIAAVQVLLWHVAIFYAPALVQQNVWFIRYTPLGLLFDGVLAVYIFFTLSGYVLAKAFGTSNRSKWALVGARLTRLGTPTIVACFFGGLLSVLFSQHVYEAAKIVGTSASPSSFSMWRPGDSLLDIIDDAWRSILFGYNVYALTPFGTREITSTYNASLWTISIELQGSLLVLLLVAVAKKFRRTGVASALLLLLLTSQTFFICFVAGHLMAQYRLAERPATSNAIAWSVIALAVVLNPVAIYSGLIFIKTTTAILIFAGIACCTQTRSLLSTPVAQWLGKMSFPLYLSHWPIMAYLGAFVLVSIHPIATWYAIPASALFTLALAFLCAAGFKRIDDISVALSHMIGTSRLLEARAEVQTGVGIR